MLTSSTLIFLKTLNSNNNKEWFNANRQQYEIAKEDMNALVSKILLSFSPIDKDIKLLSVKDCLFRINRDMRFSKDKSPYKTNLGAFFVRGGKKSNFAGYYLHIEPDKSFVGGGLYMPMADVLKKVRQEIDYNVNEFKNIVEGKKFKSFYTQGLEMEKFSLANAPKGYEKGQPGIEYLKLKSFVATKSLTDEDLTSSTVLKKITKAFEALMPMVQFFNRAIAE